MVPVIRIPDYLFERLQKHAVPLVDNPASIIEKLLNYYEENVPNLASEQKTEYKVVSETNNSGNELNHSNPNVYFVPAAGENIRTTIANKVTLASVKQFVSKSDFKKLQQAVGTDSEFNCWAMSANRLTTFKTMKPGDIVLLTEKSTGKFNWFGNVITTIINKDLGTFLWPYTAGAAWENIYILNNVKPIDINKQKLVTEFGYQPNDVVYGVRRVKDSMVNRVIIKYGSIWNCLKSLSAD